MTLHQIAELVSLWLTFPVLVLSVYVILHWKTALFDFDIKKATPLQWFILGVFIGFIGSFADNLYWLIPWTLNFMGHPSSGDWIMNGVFFNIVFRQIAGTVAAYCHIRAALTHLKHRDGQERANKILFTSVILGLIYALMLILCPYISPSQGE